MANEQKKTKLTGGCMCEAIRYECDPPAIESTTPKRAGWGEGVEAHFADPDGNIFLLIQLNSPATWF